MDGVTNKAFMSMLEFGVIGAVLVVVMIFAGGLIWWILRTSSTALKEQAAYIREINDRRVQSAEEAVAAITMITGQMARVIDMLHSLAGGGTPDDTTAA